MKRFILSVLALESLLGLTACASSETASLESVHESGKIIVATEAEFSPFEFKALVNGRDTLVGADIELG